MARPVFSGSEMIRVPQIIDRNVACLMKKGRQHKKRDFDGERVRKNAVCFCTAFFVQLRA